MIVPCKRAFDPLDARDLSPEDGEIVLVTVPEKDTKESQSSCDRLLIARSQTCQDQVGQIEEIGQRFLLALGQSREEAI